MNYTIPQEDVLGKKRKLTFSGHETFPFRYTWLKKAVDAVNDDSSIFTQESALSTLGVGKNMVMKRMRPRARGRMARILKPFSEIRIVVRERGEAN